MNQLVSLGKMVRKKPGALIYEENEKANSLFVIIEGDVHFSCAQNERMRSWFGQGDVFGEIGFLLGDRRWQTARAGSFGCLLWKVPRSLLFNDSYLNAQALTTLLLIALEPIIQIRAAKLSIEQQKRLRHPGLFCDTNHYAIRKVAAFLKRKSAWDTAISIWHFVRNMPYRFGSWYLTASETLRLGYGMCTTKANLQAALLRACGIDAGFVELIVPSKFVVSMLPAGYKDRVGSTIKHYFAAARLDNKWYPCDASFTRESLVLMADQNPEIISCLDAVFTRGQPFNPVGEKNGYHPFDFVPLLDIDHIFRKKPYYDADHFESMNIKLDRIQKAVFGVPGWVTQARENLQDNPQYAFQLAYAGIVSDACKLHKSLRQLRRVADNNKNKTTHNISKYS